MFARSEHPSDQSSIDFNFRSTPSTYVLTNEGKVIGYWSGAYASQTLKSIEDFFGLKLPGMNE